MNILCIVSFLFAAVCGLPIQPMKESMSFVDTTQEGAADDILAMIAKLRGDNENAMAHATTSLDAAQKENDDTNDALGRATNAEDQALGDLEEGEKWLVILQGKAAGAQAVEEQAQDKLDDHTDVANQAASFLASETERLDDEKATLEEVVELIDTLAASAALQVSNRQLLSIVDLSSLANADPAAVAEVKQLLLDLIQAGEDERASATQDDADAKAQLAETQSEYKKAYDELANALGKVDFQVETNAELKTIGDNAVAAKNAALVAHQNAAQVLANAQTHFDDETARVESEEDTFTKVEALMATLA